MGVYLAYPSYGQFYAVIDLSISSVPSSPALALVPAFLPYLPFHSSSPLSADVLHLDRSGMGRCHTSSGEVDSFGNNRLRTDFVDFVVFFHS